MCGRYSLSASLDDLQLSFELAAWHESFAALRPNYNVAPTHDIPVILQRPVQDDDETAPGVVDGEVRALSHAHWGLIPPWSKDGKSFMINARLETADEKRSFAGGLARRRCIIPANGYFEWKKTADSKDPYFIHRTDGELLGFAGIYGWWKTPDESWILSATIFTRAAEGRLTEIHDRTPVILETAEFAGWLDQTMDDASVAKEYVTRSNSPLTAHRVRKEVGNVANNSAQNISDIDVD